MALQAGHLGVATDEQVLTGRGVVLAGAGADEFVEVVGEDGQVVVALAAHALAGLVEQLVGGGQPVARATLDQVTHTLADGGAAAHVDQQLADRDVDLAALELDIAAKHFLDFGEAVLEVARLQRDAQLPLQRGGGLLHDGQQHVGVVHVLAGDARVVVALGDHLGMDGEDPGRALVEFALETDELSRLARGLVAGEELAGGAADREANALGELQAEAVGPPALVQVHVQVPLLDGERGWVEHAVEFLRQIVHGASEILDRPVRAVFSTRQCGRPVLRVSGEAANSTLMDSAIATNGQVYSPSWLTDRRLRHSNHHTCPLPYVVMRAG